MTFRHENIVLLGKLAKRIETAAENESRIPHKRDLQRDAQALRWAIAQLAQES